MSRDTCQDAESLKKALIRCLPSDFYSLLYGAGIVVGIVHFLLTGNTTLLITFLSITASQKGLPEVKALLSKFPKNSERLNS